VKLRFASFLIVLASGCATAVGQDVGDAGPTSKDSGANKDAGTTPKKDAGGPSTQDSGTTPVDDGGTPLDDTACAGQTTRSACEQCCLTVHPSGYKVYQQQLVDCACSSPAACASECATELCVQKATTPNDACSTCITQSLQSTGACYQGVANACQSDTDCTALFGTCIPPCENMN
jgi:hypothetical protein